MLTFAPLHAGALDQVLQWRTSPEVTRWMCSDIAPDPAAQRDWFARVAADLSCRHWLVRVEGRDVGLAYLTDIDPEEGSCEAGFYIGEEDARRLGGMVLPGLVNLAFGEMGLRLMRGEVLGGNTNILKMHDLLGYTPTGIREGAVRKQDGVHDLHLFELTRARWEESAVLFRPYRIPVEEAEGA